MKARAPEALAAAAGALVLAAAAVVMASGARPDPDRAARHAAVSRALGGLGGAGAAAAAPCGPAFDDVLGDACDRDLEPLPAGVAFCPYHGLAAAPRPARPAAARAP